MACRSLFIAACFSVLAATAQNLVENPTFERHQGDVPDGWGWEAGAAKATQVVDTQVSRSGKASLRLSNPTTKGPNVYSTLTQAIRVKANATYTVSCYVKSDDAGLVWIGGGKKWEHRFAFPRDTKGEWQRVVGTFTTTPGETTFTLRILTESPTAALWIDDVQLEAGSQPTDFVYIAPLDPGQSRLDLSPFDPGQNLVPNPSFEQVDSIRPKGWMWDQRNTNATMTVETGTAHSGTTSVKFVNSTAFGPHVYGWFGFTAGVPVKAGTTYTLTAFVRSAKPGRAWIGGGQGWKVRCPVPTTGEEWRRISKTFTTQPDETSFALMFVTESPTDGIWLDDVSLREGIRPLPAALEGAAVADYVDLAPKERDEVLNGGGAPVNTRWAPQRWPEDQWTFSSGPLRAEGILTLADPAAGASVVAELLDGAGKTLLSQTAVVPAAAKAVFLTLRGNISEVQAEQVVLRANLLREGKTLAHYEQRMELVTPARIRAKLQESVARRDSLAERIAQLQTKGLGAYARVTLTVLDNFIPWVEADIRNDRPDRAWDAACLLADLTARAGQSSEFPVPRYQTGPLAVDGPSTVGTRRFPDGRVEQGPVFLTGYGHFRQVRQDIEKFPGYGCNFFQIEFGPRDVLPDENSYSDRAIDSFREVCDRAAKADVAVNLLLSPHYFPNWALAKWPDLKDCKGGFMQYCVHDPRARSVVEKSLRYVIPRIKDLPALHSVCLSNEPICVDLRGCAVTAKAWPAWLQARHGDIATLNRRWRTEYQSFAEIPIPAPEFTATPMSVDFVRYNQEAFAEFHAWMAGIIHEIAPDLPVHAKIMMSAHFGRSLHGMWSVSPELFADFSQYNGNDCCNWFHRGGDWSTGWAGMEGGYDFQRSMADMPVFNSENHMIVDGDQGVIPPEHLYTELWQGAIHGQSSTTYWVWERTNSFTDSLTGSILHRPDGIEAFGRCNLDLNRLAPEVVSIQRVPPALGVLWSASSIIEGDQHKTAMWRAYEGAAFQGVQLGFVTERRLEAYAKGETKRPLDSLQVLLVPQVTHLSDSARAGLAKLAGTIRVVVLGDAPACDEYGNPVADPAIPGAILLPLPETAEELCQILAQQLSGWGVKPLVSLADEQGKLPFGIEVHAATHNGRRLAAVCDLLREPRTITVGTPSTDLISGQDLPAQFTVEPLKPLLLQLP